MNIVILAGGTGSIALQTGLYNMLDRRIDGVDTKIIVNAYDNGLSTGAVRKVLGGKILGPSDVRKNQTTRLKLENPTSPWNKFLDIRFTCESNQAKSYCLGAVSELARELGETQNPLHVRLVEEAIGVFFSSPIAEKIDYNDFSLANIIYAGFAKAHNNSLREAARVMAMIMGIKDNVLLNDDISLFLGAITKSGIRVTDEGDIVAWNNPADPFVDIFFTDASGNEAVPVLCDEARDALLAADLIILSSGTQWSSLIPTYASKGFAQTISHCPGKIIMVMNRQPDKDSPGQTASEIVNILIPKYFPKGRVHLLLDSQGNPQMATVDSSARELLASVNEFPMQALSGPTSKHCPDKLALAVGKVFFRDALDSAHYMFDYDDTLVGRGNYQPAASALNKHMICILKNISSASICTGNSIKAISIDNEWISDVWGAGQYRPLTVFADGGLNEYEYDTRREKGSDDGDDESFSRYKFVRCADPSLMIPSLGDNSASNIMSALKQHGIPLSKIENRGNAVISIRPIDSEYRPAILALVKIILKNTGLSVKPAGRTTIDIMNQGTSKAVAVKSVLSRGIKSITFIGDEFSNGNDAIIAEMADERVKCLPVKDPAMTAFFLITLIHVKESKNG